MPLNMPQTRFGAVYNNPLAILKTEEDFEPFYVGRKFYYATDDAKSQDLTTIRTLNEDIREAIKTETNQRILKIQEKSERVQKELAAKAIDG